MNYDPFRPIEIEEVDRVIPSDTPVIVGLGPENETLFIKAHSVRGAGYMPYHLKMKRSTPDVVASFRDPKGQPGRYSKRVMISDFVVGMLGQIMEAPVAKAQLVHLTPELIDRNKKDISFAIPGLAYGSHWLGPLTPAHQEAGLTEEEKILNEHAACRLEALYELAGVEDRQPVFTETTTKLIRSFDHGFAFTGKQRTTTTITKANLDFQRGGILKLLNLVSPGNGYSPAAQMHAAIGLANLDDACIRGLIRQIPVDWSCSDREKEAMFRYLILRRNVLHSGLVCA